MMTSTALLRALCLSTAMGASLNVAYAAGPSPKPADVETIIVTGTNIRTSPDAIAVRVSVVSSEAISKAGVSTNVLEILRKQIPAFAGRSNTGNSNAANTNQNTAGGSSIQLRNLDTLILVNGRRVASSAISGVNGKVFVNVSEIPPAAIERLEVLTDGASAIYGSDAIGGVVNIILKSDYEGGQVSARYGGASGYNERSVDASYGFNPFKGTNVTVSASYSKSSPLYQNQRAFSTPFYSTARNVPGAIGVGTSDYFLNPGVTTPTPANAASTAANAQYTNAGATTGTAPGTGIGGTYDLSRFGTLLLQQEQKSLAAGFTSDLSGGAHRFVLFGDLEYAKNDNFTRFAPQTANVKALAGSPFDPNTIDTTVVFGSTTNPKTYTTSEESVRGTIGLKGDLPSVGRSWNWEADYTHSENTIDQTIANVIYAKNLAPAVNGGFDASGNQLVGGGFSKVTSIADGASLILQPALNPFAIAAGVAPGALNNVLTSERIHGRSKLDTADAKIAGTIGSLPGGKPSFAIGLQWRREALSGAPDANAYVHVGGTLAGAPQALLTGGLSADPFSASRTITSQYLEVRIPITGADMNVPGFYNFDLIGAVRHEHYSDAGDSTVPKIGFRWQPVPKQITLRGNYARSFTAPSLYAEGGPLNVRQGGAAIITNAFPSAIAGTTMVEDGNNPNLKPAKSESFSLGLVLKPEFIPRLKVDVEFSSVKETGQPAGIGFNNILIDVNKYGSASQFYTNIATGAFPGSTGAVLFNNPGDVLAYVTNPANVVGGNYPNLFLIDRFTNLGQIKIKSLNVAAEYSVPTAGSGTLNFATQAAFLLSYKYLALPNQLAADGVRSAVYEFAGTTTQGGGAQGTLPRFRAYTTLDWTIGHWDAGAGVTYIGAVTDLGIGGLTYDTGLTAALAAQAKAAAAGTAIPINGFIPGHVSSYTAIDLRLTYNTSTEGGRAKGLSVTAGVNNLFDQLPPVSTNIDPTGGHAAGATAWRAENKADVSTYGAIGRLIYVSATVKF